MLPVFLCNFFDIAPQVTNLFTQDDPFDTGCRPTCLTGKCAHCNDRCFLKQTGECADCWEEEDDFACMSTNVSVMNCVQCWAYTPCALCDTGNCAKCKQCQDTKEGNCSSCWNEKTILLNETCLSDDAMSGCQGCWNTSSPPVVYVPGLTSSALNATYSAKVPGCFGTTLPSHIWPTPTNITSLKDLLCYLEIVKLTFHNDTQRYESTKGVNITTAKPFGSMNGFGFGEIIVPVLEKFGYRAGLNLFGSVFDWRYTTDGLETYFKDLKELIERIYEDRKHKVTLIAISYGPQIALGFLHRMTLEWKDKYINWFMAEAPVWSGAPATTLSITSGYPILPGVPLGFSRTLALKIGATLWLQPRPGNDSYTYSKDEVLVSTPSKNYSAWDMETLLTDIGFKHQIPAYRYLLESRDLAKFEAPLVNTFVSYGSVVDTPASFYYDVDFNGSSFFTPILTSSVNVSGDGVVAVKSSQRSMLWKKEQDLYNKTLLHKDYAGLPHGSCLFPFNLDPDHPTSECFYDVLKLMLGLSPPTDTM